MEQSSTRGALITGATSGIGRAAALEMARRGVDLWLVGRSPERLESVAGEARTAGAARVRTLRADLSLMAEVREAAQRVLDDPDPLQVLVNNAGAVIVERTETCEGIEATLALNHLAPFLLTNLLLPKLRASAPARVVTVSSGGHKLGRIRLDDLGASQSYNGFIQYCNTKLANVLFTRELAKRTKGTGVTASCLHPGAVRTGLGMNNEGLARRIWRLAHPLMLSPERGAETLVHLALAPELEALSGGYFVRRRERTPARLARDSVLAEQLWRESARLTGLPA